MIKVIKNVNYDKPSYIVLNTYHDEYISGIRHARREDADREMTEEIERLSRLVRCPDCGE